MGTTREALEAALAAEPESVALHSAYADLLIEEGDPRGEFIRLSLMLEDATLAEDERKVMERQAEKILAKNEREWLGQLFPYCEDANVISSRLAAFMITWNRGWIAEVDVRSVDVSLYSLLSNNPLAKFNRVLRVSEIINLLLLDEIDLGDLFGAIRTVAFGELEFFSLGSVGDGLVVWILKSDLLSRLSSLAIEYCDLTDDGALMLANSPAIRRLKSLNLDNNYLSPIGIAALAEVGFAIGPQRDNPAWDGGADAV